MVEGYQQGVSVANLGGIRDVQGLYSQLGLKNSPQVLISTIGFFVYVHLKFDFTCA